RRPRPRPRSRPPGGRPDRSPSAPWRGRPRPWSTGRRATPLPGRLPPPGGVGCLQGEGSCWVFCPARPPMTTISKTVVNRRSGPVFDYILVLATIIVAIAGLVMVYSATRGSLLALGEDPLLYVKKQALFVVLGVVVMVAFALFDYRRLEPIAIPLYLLSVL